MAEPVPEMVERVARRICELYGEEPDKLLPAISGREWLSPTQPRWRSYTPQAIAAIEVMRKPTEAMSEAGDLAARAEGAHDCEIPMSDVWRAMIDAALGKH